MPEDEGNPLTNPFAGPGRGRMVRTGGQKTVIATFRHDTSRNLDPALHTYAVIVNMVRGADDKALLKEQLEAVTGERSAALKAVEPDKAKGREAGVDAARSVERESAAPASQKRDKSPEPAMEPSRAPKTVDRGLGL